MFGGQNCTEAGYLFFEYFGLTLLIITPTMFHTHLSPKVGTTGPFETAVPNDLLTPFL
jgi:hypothetical protein